jgi:hypothetical protein
MNARAQDTALEKKVLVVYYSLSGNTARVAKHLATLLDADIEVLRDADHGAGWLGALKASMNAWRRKPGKIDSPCHDPSRYELTLIGTPVWAWQVTPAVRAYLQLMAGRMRNLAVFVTSGNTDVGRIAPSIESIAARKAIASAGFNAMELKDQTTYDRKIATFMQAIQAFLSSFR